MLRRLCPHQVPLIVECVTDNINRTVAEIRVAFRKGQLGASGSVAWMFNHVGMIEASWRTPRTPIRRWRESPQPSKPSMAARTVAAVLLVVCSLNTYVFHVKVDRVFRHIQQKEISADVLPSACPAIVPAVF